MKTKKYRIGGVLAGQTITITDDLLKYQSAYNKRFSVSLSQIDTVTVDTAKGFGKSKLKIVGAGSTLAELEIPSNWATKAQAWLLANLPENKKASGAHSIDDLEKLAELKNKGIITEAEFNTKKKDILS